MLRLDVVLKLILQFCKVWIVIWKANYSNFFYRMVWNWFLFWNTDWRNCRNL